MTFFSPCACDPSKPARDGSAVLVFASSKEGVGARDGKRLPIGEAGLDCAEAPLSSVLAMPQNRAIPRVDEMPTSSM